MNTVAAEPYPFTFYPATTALVVLVVDRLGVRSVGAL